MPSRCGKSTSKLTSCPYRVHSNQVNLVLPVSNVLRNWRTPRNHFLPAISGRIPNRPSAHGRTRIVQPTSAAVTSTPFSSSPKTRTGARLCVSEARLSQGRNTTTESIWCSRGGCSSLSQGASHCSNKNLYQGFLLEMSFESRERRSAILIRLFEHLTGAVNRCCLI